MPYIELETTLAARYAKAKSFSTSKRFSVSALVLFYMSNLTGALSVDKCLFTTSLVINFRGSRGDSVDGAQVSAFHS